MNRAAAYRAGAVLVPVVALLIGGGTTWAQYHRYRASSDEQALVEKQIADTTAQIKEMQTTPMEGRVPTEVVSPQEQPEFLSTLRATADASRVRLIRWTNVAPVQASAPAAAAGPGTGGQPAAAGAMPPGVTAVSSTVEVEGTYPAVRSFLYGLARTRRLLNATDVRWTRSTPWPLTRLSFTLTRYTTTRPAHDLATQGAQHPAG